MIVAATERNMIAPARVTPYDQRPQIDIDAADHVVVGRIQTSDEIAIAGLSDYFPPAPLAVVRAGYLGVMIVSTGLATRGEEGLDGKDRLTHRRHTALLSSEIAYPPFFMRLFVASKPATGKPARDGNDDCQ